MPSLFNIFKHIRKYFLSNNKRISLENLIRQYIDEPPDGNALSGLSLRNSELINYFKPNINKYSEKDRMELYAMIIVVGISPRRIRNFFKMRIAQETSKECVDFLVTCLVHHKYLN